MDNTLQLIRDIREDLYKYSRFTDAIDEDEVEMVSNRIGLVLYKLAEWLCGIGINPTNDRKTKVTIYTGILKDYTGEIMRILADYLLVLTDFPNLYHPDIVDVGDDYYILEIGIGPQGSRITKHTIRISFRKSIREVKTIQNFQPKLLT